MDQKVRTDKWLWAVRLYKTRSLAADACEKGKVRSGDQTLKAGIERIMKDRIDGVTAVVQVS